MGSIENVDAGGWVKILGALLTIVGVLAGM